MLRSKTSEFLYVGSGVGYDSLNRTIRSFSGFHGPWIPSSCLQITTISLGLKSKGFRNVNLWLKNYVAKRKEFVEWSIKNSIQIRGEYPHLVGSLRSLRSTLLFLTIVSRSTIPFTCPKLDKRTQNRKRERGGKKTPKFNPEPWATETKSNRRQTWQWASFLRERASSSAGK